MAKRKSNTTDMDSASNSSKRQRTSSESSPTLLSIPQELRDMIYGYILDDIVRPPVHVWDELSKPKMFLSLMLVNRQFNAEVSELFQKLYADQFTLYFDDLLHIYHISKNMASYPALNNPRFWIRSIAENIEDELQGARPDGVLMLIDRQPGWKDEWTDYPGCYQTEGDHLTGAVWGRDWIPEDHGFTLETILHDDCDNQCILFKKLQFPLDENGLRVVSYGWSWEDVPIDDDEDFPYSSDQEFGDSGAMTLEGRFDDLTYEGVPIESVRNRMACERRKKQEGREYKECGEECGCFPKPLTEEDLANLREEARRI